MFQFSTLMKSITSVIICTTIYNAIKYGRVIDMWDQSVLSWIVFGVGVTILSISYDTAELFCPFNFEHSMYYKNIPLSSPRLDRLVVYGCCYLFPVTLCFSFNCLYSWRSHQHARSLHVGSITAVARQLLMYPIVLGIAICPLFLFVFLTILTGHEVRPLLYIGAIIVSSVGTANAFVFFRIVHANRNSWRQNSNFVTDTKHTSTHSMAATFLTPNHSELSSINATQNGSSELSDLLYEVGD